MLQGELETTLSDDRTSPLSSPAFHQAYREGRAESNPADNWYEGELGFLDFYIIPLSKKLRDCGVFGPTSDENLN